MAVRATLLALLLMLAVAGRAGSPAGPDHLRPPPDTMAARMQGCSTCHGAVGQGSPDGEFPRIAGKPQGYLFNQLQSFREGRRSYPPMNYLLAYLHDDYFHDIAAFFSEQRVPPDRPEHSALPAAQLALGSRLVHEGDGARGIPACMSCHGPQLTGINPGIPGLLGLRSRYISAQLGEWRAGTRRALAPDCMHDIAHRLSEQEVTAVAAWLATQAEADSAVPASAGSWQTPISCGSQPQ